MTWVRVLVTVLLPAALHGESVGELATLDFDSLLNVPIVSGARHKQAQADSPRAISVITGDEIRRRGFRNLPEALSEMTGVFLQQTNYAGGAPIIRGMVGNRILLMLNGVRLNSGIYRLGPNQYLSYIDLGTVERIEVIRGPGSVLYGSDALGGVINIITHSAMGAGNGSEVRAELALRTSTADRSARVRAGANARYGALGVTAGASRDVTGDVRTAGVRQFHTGYRQWAGDVAGQYTLSETKSLHFGYFRLRQFDARRNDAMTNGSEREYTWDPQGSDLATLQYVQSSPVKGVDQLSVTASYHYQRERLLRRTAAEPNTRRDSNDSVGSFGTSVQLSSMVGTRQLITYGVESYHDDVSSSRTDTNILTGIASPARGAYAEGAHFQNASAFLQDEIDLHPRVSATLGLRYDRFRVRAASADRFGRTIMVDLSPSAVTGSAYVLTRPSKNFEIGSGLAEGFRAPNLDDTTVVNDVASRFEVPNPKLSPERSVSAEAFARYRTERFHVGATYFHSWYRHLIERSIASSGGRTFIDANGNGVKDKGEPDLYQRQNVGHAAATGVEVEAGTKLSRSVSIAASTTQTRGSDSISGLPLSRIPPLNGLVRLTWRPAAGLWMEWVTIGACRQDRLSVTDRADRRIDPTGTDGFAVTHLRLAVDRSALAGLTLSLENLADRRYRLHGSGVDRPGRSVVIGYLRWF